MGNDQQHWVQVAYEQLAINLRQQRSNKQLTLEQVAAGAEILPALLEGLEGGSARKVSIDVWLSLAAYYNIELYQLCRGM